MRGDTDNTAACTDLLRQWLNRKARAEFAPWLRELSFDIDLPFFNRNLHSRPKDPLGELLVAKKIFSLNYKLLFLPSELVHYVFVHELCHTIYMNHSQAFWNLVKEKQPGYEP